jgi:MFS family permease
MIVGGMILLLVQLVDGAAVRIGLIILGSGICAGIYVVCPAMISEFVPAAQRGAVLAIYGALYTLAGILAPTVMGSIVEAGATPLAGFLTGFKVLSCILIAAGTLGLLLLWPDSERARLQRAMDNGKGWWQIGAPEQEPAKAPRG